MNNAKVSIIKIIGEEDSVINKAQKMPFTFEDQVIIKHYRLKKDMVQNDCSMNLHRNHGPKVV